jgi:acyl-CoA dehydrogenase
MDFELNQEQEALRASARSALERESPATLAREVVEQGTCPDEPFKIAGELGWLATGIPEAVGGLGLGAIELALLCEEHGRALAPGPFLATSSQFVPLVREAGSEAQQRRFLGPVAAGSLAGALGCANRAGGHRRPDEALAAQRDGNGWRLRGSRHWVMNGDSADEIVVVASVAAGDAVGLFVLPAASVETRRVTALDGTRSLCEIEVDGVHIDAERTLGTPGECAPALDRTLDEATAALAIETVGSCEALFEITLEYAKQREQFGQPIGAFQAIQHKFADLFIALEKARATCLFAAMTLAERDPRAPLATSMAKVTAGDCQRLLVKEAIQIHGGVGFTWEQDVHLYAKRIQSSEKLFGTSAEHRARIADLLEI